MKKILALNNINTIQSVYVDLTSRDVAYTDKLLELNVIIDFYGVPISNKVENREETNVSATIYRDGIFHHYILFSSVEILGPLVVTRLIVDAVQFIETCDRENVIEELKKIATDYLVVEKNEENIEYYEITETEYIDALKMIKKNMENLK
jgi:hypothetical protein